MLLVNTENIPGKNYEVIGLVTGVSIMCKNIGKDFGAGLRNIVGGQMKAYQDMLNESKDNALEKMQENAAAMGADAIVNIRFSSSNIVQGGAEILVAGTAVKFI